jgi:2-polyprenyl-3-methyl-5-hydroxy-6-metoxy-1,4-benzoquinol methylase
VSPQDLDRAAEHYYFTPQQTGIDNRCRERMIRRCLKHLSSGDVLELGFMDGQWTEHFLAKGCRVTIVEGATRQLEYGRQKYAHEPRVSLVHGRFETYEPTTAFDCIHMGGMLKHMEDPVALLRRARGWLAPDGMLIATTPNGRSLHRRVGTYMGLLENLHALSETDIKVGNLRHYDLDSFRALLTEGGFEIVELATAILKPVSSQLMADWPDDLLDALDRVASEIPDFGWYIYAICRLNPG